MTPNFVNFVQNILCEGFAGKADLPAMVHVHDNSSGLPFPDILEDFFNPPGVCLMANYRGVIDVSRNNNNLWDSIERNKDWVHG